MAEEKEEPLSSSSGIIAEVIIWFNLNFNYGDTTNAKSQEGWELARNTL